MSEVLKEHRVTCHRCRYRFTVEANAGDNWRVEAQCPICEVWACFTVADTRDFPLPDPKVLEAETQRLGELLWKPINEHRGHAALEWMDMVGNGMFEDDYSPICWPVPHWVYRFKRGQSAAYLWEEEGTWFARDWGPLQVHCCVSEPVEVFSFEAGLDYLIR